MRFGEGERRSIRRLCNRISNCSRAFLCKNDEFKDIKIDFWCSTASQVGFFEELKLFLASDKKYMKGNPEHVAKMKRLMGAAYGA